MQAQDPKTTQLSHSVIERVLLAKKKELSGRQISHGDIAIEKNAELFDEIQRNADRTLALDQLTRNWKTSSLVAEALRKVEDGSYGLCAECEEPINEKRLAAIPWAKFCIRCQELADTAATEEQWAEAA